MGVGRVIKFFFNYKWGGGGGSGQKSRKLITVLRAVKFGGFFQQILCQARLGVWQSYDS